MNFQPKRKETNWDFPLPIHYLIATNEWFHKSDDTSLNTLIIIFNVHAFLYNLTLTWVESWWFRCLATGSPSGEAPKGMAGLA